MAVITITNLSTAVPEAKALEKTTDPESTSRKKSKLSSKSKCSALKAKLGQSGKHAVLIEFAPPVNKRKRIKAKCTERP